MTLFVGYLETPDSLHDTAGMQKNVSELEYLGYARDPAVHFVCNLYPERCQGFYRVQYHDT